MKPHIALVEDNPDNRLLVHALLEDEFRISEYENGADALEGIRAEQPELVLLDISLPEMDGTEVLRRMREDESMKGIPAIALTAHAMAGDRERFLSLGFEEYITKPIVDDLALIEAIHSLIRASDHE